MSNLGELTWDCMCHGSRFDLDGKCIEVELTWDCMCHGSRFDLDGKCIEGPSNFDIKYYK